MSGISERLAICEAVLAGELTLDEARDRRDKILQRSQGGRLLLRIEQAERIARKGFPLNPATTN
jgi:hypothetical protein